MIKHLPIWLIGLTTVMPSTKQLAAQNSITQQLLVSKSNDFNSYKIAESSISDTVACVFREVVPERKPAMLWRSGFIVLPNRQINIDHTWYPVSKAVTLSGPIHNQFLTVDKKIAIQANVIQVVLL